MLAMNVLRVQSVAELHSKQSHVRAWQCMSIRHMLSQDPCPSEGRASSKRPEAPPRCKALHRHPFIKEALRLMIVSHGCTCMEHAPYADMWAWMYRILSGTRSRRCVNGS